MMMVTKVSEQVFDSNGNVMESFSSGVYYRPEVMKHIDRIVRVRGVEYYVVPDPPRKAPFSSGGCSIERAATLMEMSGDPNGPRPPRTLIGVVRVDGEDRNHPDAEYCLHPLEPVSNLAARGLNWTHQMHRQPLTKETLQAFQSWFQRWPKRDQIRSALTDVWEADNPYEPEANAIITVTCQTLSGESMELCYSPDQIVFFEHMYKHLTRGQNESCEADENPNSEDPEHLSFVVQEAGTGVRPSESTFQKIDPTTLTIPHTRQTAWEHLSSKLPLVELETFYPADEVIYAQGHAPAGAKNVRK